MLFIDIEREKRGKSPYLFKRLLRKRQLIKWGFSFDKHPVLGDYLIMHWSETTKLAQIANKWKSHWFAILPKYAGLILKFGLYDLVTILQATDSRNRQDLFILELPELVKIIQKYGLVDLAKIAQASRPENTKFILQQLRLQEYDYLIQKYGLLNVGLNMVRISNATRPDDVGVLLATFRGYRWSRAVMDEPLLLKQLANNYGLEDLANIAESARPKDVLRLFTFGLPAIAHIVHSRENLREIGTFLAKNGIGLFNTYLVGPFFQNIHTKEEFYEKFNEYRLLIENKTFWTIQGLNSMGFLCLHVTNVESIGAPLAQSQGDKLPPRRDPFDNIVNDISNRYDYNPSISVIGPSVKSSLVLQRYYPKIEGSIGVIYDYGYIYEAAGGEAFAFDFVSKSGSRYRTGGVLSMTDPAMVLKYNIGLHNEMLIRKWTVSGIFYTTGCQPWVVEKLKKISDELSFKEYVNGAYWYRTAKIGTSRNVIKVFPVYEINPSDNSWKIIYTPQKPNFEVRLDKPNNNTYTAISR